MPYLRPATPNFFGLFKKADPPGKLCLVLSSCFGIGLIPGAPGTFGTLAGMPLAIGLAWLNPVSGACFLFFFVLLAVGTSYKSAKALEKEDPAEIVIDEIAGLLVTLFLLPATGANLCLGFILFRVFDILKPFPVRKSESLGHGIGIVLDDLLAGVYGNICLRLLTHAFGL